MLRKIVTKLILIGVITTAAPSASFSHGNVIGNGGNGLDFGDRVILRDIYETMGEESPFFGTVASERFRVLSGMVRLQDHSHSTYPGTIRLLALKLTELERVSPLLGDLLAAALLHLQFKVVNQPLFLIPEPDTQFGLPTSASLVAVANRERNKVQIDELYWKRLGASGQAALLVHETVGALVRPACFGSPDNCVQSALLTRELVGLLFTAHDQPEYLRQTQNLLKSLNVSASLESAAVRRMPFLRLFSKGKTCSTSFDFPLSYADDELASPPTIHSFAIHACNQMKSICRTQDSEILADFKTLPFKLRFHEYISTRGPQSALSVEAAQSSSAESAPRLAQPSCTAEVEKLIEHSRYTP